MKYSKFIVAASMIFPVLTSGMVIGSSDASKKKGKRCINAKKVTTHNLTVKGGATFENGVQIEGDLQVDGTVSAPRLEAEGIAALEVLFETAQGGELSADTIQALEIIAGHILTERIDATEGVFCTIGAQNLSFLDPLFYTNRELKTKCELGDLFDQDAFNKLLNDQKKYSCNQKNRWVIFDNLLKRFIEISKQAFALTNCGPIYTVDKETKDALFASGPEIIGTVIPAGGVIVIRQGKIHAVYSTFADFEASDDAGLAQKDIGGNPVYPGFHDSHVHTGAQSALVSPITNPANVTGLTSVQAVRDEIERVVSTNPDAVVEITLSDGSTVKTLRGGLYDNSLWTDFPEAGTPNKELLDGIPGAEDVAIILSRVDGHAVLQNSLAIQTVSNENFGGDPLPDPPQGLMPRRENGDIIGTFIDTPGAWKLTSLLPSPDAEAILAGAELVFQKAVSEGFTYWHDAFAISGIVDPFFFDLGWQVYKDFVDNLVLPLKYTLLVGTPFDGPLGEEYDKEQRTLTQLIKQTGPIKQYGGMVNVAHSKYLCDGAMGSRGAYLLHDYEDEPGSIGNQGELESYRFFAEEGFPGADWPVVPGDISDPEVAIEQWKEIFKSIFDSNSDIGVAFHSIGNRSARETIEGYIRAAENNSQAKHLRNRCEHSQYMEPEDRTKMAENNLIASMQPRHQFTDSRFVPFRLVPIDDAPTQENYDSLLRNDPNSFERLTKTYAWRRFQDEGVVLAFGSDSPVEPSDWRLGWIQALSSPYGGLGENQGKPWLSDPDTGLYTGDYAQYDQRVSRNRTLRSFTRDAAYAARIDDKLGSIERGKAADLLILDRDIMDERQTPVDELVNVKTLYTIVDGRVVFDGTEQLTKESEATTLSDKEIILSSSRLGR